ncbi:MAG: rod shape-determining protein MreD, partial [Selenomonadaceae bacterium]
MSKTVEQIIQALLLLIFQIVILNNIQLFGMIAPFLYILTIITLPIKMPRGYIMLYACILGGTMDIFTHSYGLHLAATALVAYIRPYIMQLFATRENMEKLEPSYKNFGLAFYKYALGIVIIHHFCLFMIEAFSFKYIGVVILKTL